MIERSKDILKSSYIKKVDKVPDFMPKQRKLIEFARDAAKYIINENKDER